MSKQICPVCFITLDSTETQCPICGWNLKEKSADESVIHKARMLYWHKRFLEEHLTKGYISESLDWGTAKRQIIEWTNRLPDKAEELADIDFIDILPQGIDLIIHTMVNIITPQVLEKIGEEDRDLPPYFLSKLTRGLLFLIDYLNSLYVQFNTNYQKDYKELSERLHLVIEKIQNIQKEKSAFLLTQRELLSKSDELKKEYMEFQILKNRVKELEKIKNSFTPKQLETLRKRAKILEERYGSLKKENDSLKDKIMYLQRVINELTKVKKDLEMEKEEVILNLDHIIKKIAEDLDKKVAGLKNDLGKIAKQIEEQKREFSKILYKVKEKKQELEELTEKHKKMLNAISKHLEANMRVANNLLREYESEDINELIESLFRKLSAKLVDLEEEVEETDSMLKTALEQYEKVVKENRLSK